MKKFSVAIVLFLAFASVLALTKEEAKQKLKEANDSCNADPATALSKDEIKKWREDGGEKPANAGAHALCVSKALGWQDADGNLKTESLKQHMLKSSIPEDKVEAFLGECSVKKATPEETAEHMFHCFMDHARKHAHDHGN